MISLLSSTKPKLLHLLLLLLFFLSLFFLLLAQKAAAYSQPKQGCPGNCGSLTIPYPFGLTEDCSLDDSFIITCQHSSDHGGGNYSPTPFLSESNLTVLNISLDGHLRVSTLVASDCYNKSGFQTNSYFYHTFNFSRFHISTSKNAIWVIGCDTIGLILSTDREEENTTTGCISLCARNDSFLKNGFCHGIGCCKATIPSEMSSLILASLSAFNHTMVYDFNKCGYVFIAEEGAYVFNTRDLTNFQKKTSAAVVDWGVGNKSCDEVAKKNLACISEHSECVDSHSGIGYLCLCSHGYHGNPYLLGSCRDIDECLDQNICNKNAACINFDGGFKCPCRDGYEGDGMPGGTGCHLKVNGNSELKTLLVSTLSVSVSVFGLLLGGSYIYWTVKKRKLLKMREKFFQQNGGLLLQQQIARHRGTSSQTAKIFTAKELIEATNNFDESRVLGQGGHGTVYKGVLPNDTLVAVKKSKICDQNQIEEFINEVIVLSQINHRNVVKLLGCCLETEVPLLVYEFITDGTLSKHIHGQSQSSKLTWKTRLRIAAESAGALAYLHSATSTPIIHRDVKTTNILLDHNFTAKIADFGASRFVPLDQTQLTTLVQGTLGYLDPEYFQTSQLTEKSDVYSFGVVLAELLTSKKALSFDRPESSRNLSMFFVSSMKEGKFIHIVDKLMFDDAKVEQVLEVADLAKRCLSVKGEDRPSMKEVAMELEGLMIAEKHPWRHGNVSLEETQYLLEPFSSTNVAYIGDHVSGVGTASISESMNQITTSLDDCGR